MKIEKYIAYNMYGYLFHNNKNCVIAFEFFNNIGIHGSYTKREISSKLFGIYINKMSCE